MLPSAAAPLALVYWNLRQHSFDVDVDDADDDADDDDVNAMIFGHRRSSQAEGHWKWWLM